MSNVGESSAPTYEMAAASNMENLQRGSRLHWKQKWGPRGNECLVMLLQEEQDAISGLPSSFKTEVWTRVWSAYVLKTIDDVSITQLKNRWKTLKKNYRIYTNLLNKSGWSWDYVSHCPTPDSPDIWDEVLKVNKDYKIARESSFPLYWTMHALAGMSIATCRYVMGSIEEHTLVDITEGCDESDSPDEQEQHDGIRSVPASDDIEVIGVREKRKQAQSSRNATDHTKEAIDKLLELSDRRSKIVEQYRDDDESFSYKLCMEKLTALPEITAEEMYFSGQAFKQREERIYFLTIPPRCVSFWLSRKVLEYRN
ncbi:hypothetical protein J5N97_026254 [Dioscorea zingiberensis]|uniref:Myb/SANT-like domain-containing protein n=1 Tax=Dioscorea zingiberensis TaxID=325984 RepID=A0A9D5H6I9_9LILI|nr:hypothetical protein J5N97_026254 [Dioscorea zingiberensis]